MGSDPGLPELEVQGHTVGKENGERGREGDGMRPFYSSNGGTSIRRVDGTVVLGECNKDRIVRLRYRGLKDPESEDLGGATSCITLAVPNNSNKNM